MGEMVSPFRRGFSDEKVLSDNSFVVGYQCFGGCSVNWIVPRDVFSKSAVPVRRQHAGWAAVCRSGELCGVPDLSRVERATWLVSRVFHLYSHPGRRIVR